MALITDLDDRTLVERHRAGDPDAFRRIVVRHHRSLYRNALRRLGEPAAAEDAVQDAFIRAFRNLERFDGDYHLDAWLHRILTNTCHDIGRRRGRDTRLFARACTEVDVDEPAADEALDATPVEQITEALDSLPESYREVLILRFVEELSYADVADKAGISEENARARVSRGRNMLKRMLTTTSALVVWAIPPLRRQAQLSGAEAEAANQAAAQVHGLATIATAAPAPTQAFNQLSGIIAQAGPAIATAAPAVTGAGPAVKAAMAVGIAASVAIPAGVAVDRAREMPEDPTAQSVDESAVASPGSPVVVEAPAEPKPQTGGAAAPVQALSAGDHSTVTDVSPSTTVGSTTTSIPSTTATPSTSTPPSSAGEAATPSPAPAPSPTDEQPTAEPAPAPAPAPAADPAQLSATLDVTTVGDQLHVAGPLSLARGDSTIAGQLAGKLMLGPVDAKDGVREVSRSTLRLDLESGAKLELTIYGTSTVTRRGNTETHDLDLRFMLPGGAHFGLAEDGQLEGTLVVKQGTGDLGLAIPGAPADS